jgi:hypothetical protein
METCGHQDCDRPEHQEGASELDRMHDAITGRDNTISRHLRALRAIADITGLNHAEPCRSALEIAWPFRRDD